MAANQHLFGWDARGYPHPQQVQPHQHKPMCRLQVTAATVPDVVPPSLYPAAVAASYAWPSAPLLQQQQTTDVPPPPTSTTQLLEQRKASHGHATNRPRGPTRSSI